MLAQPRRSHLRRDPIEHLDAVAEDHEDHIRVCDHAARILLVHDNATFRDLIRDLGTPALARTLPPHPQFPSPDELARVAATHDLTPLGAPMTDQDTEEILSTSR